MRTLAIAVAVAGSLGACAVDPQGGAGGDDGSAGSGSDLGSGSGSGTPDTADPRTCDQSLTLDGETTMSMSAPISVTTDSIGWCIHLNGLASDASHVAADTRDEAGDASSFQLVLLDSTGTLLQTGWDVSVSDTATQTFANLEYNTPIHQATDVILRTRAIAGTASTTLSVGFFDPLD